MKSKKSKKHTKPLIGVAANAKAAASKTGFDVSEIKAAKDAGCPAFHQSGRIDCDALIEWIAANPDEVGISGKVNKHVEEALRIRVDRITREVKLSKLKEQLVSRRGVQQGCQAVMSLIFTELDRLLLSEAPGTLKGLDESGIYKWGENKINELRSTLAVKFAAIGENENED